MFKKLVSVAASVAMMVAVAVPALAEVNWVNVTNTTQAVAITGITAANQVEVTKAGVGNITLGGIEVEKLHTGDASADAYGVVVANVQIGGCPSCGFSWDFNRARVENITLAQAETGVQAVNSVDVTKAHTGNIRLGDIEVEKLSTGNADSHAIGVVVVNTSWTPMFHF
ncbi:hypothetical protein A2188_00175 [Candidatus Woesebacteria bacterium RIFOXYA1_FULL_43_9]|uniref:Right handed beta helix domain-containing protein n=1 Tax=Candidatus Woesebacteria bacterium RIFOXYA1_FULL_43_9 TaxID=1802534 RepID=A0A1F8CMC9_9BACT|nr:MAG: hypothetical protein A2188_00175 [Candidatus Woesebacteria bacterium RIFOXYA1_FULL_43_9]